MDAEAVLQMYLDGQSAWPEVELEFSAFASHVAALSEAGAAGTEAPRRGAELFLCCAAIHGGSAAVRALEHEVLAPARGAITSVRSDSEFVQETVQVLWDHLLAKHAPRLAKYSGRGPLQAWVRVVATRTALDRCRALGLAAQRQTELTDWFASAEPQADQLLSKARYGEAFQGALRESVASLPVRERNALRMHVTGGCSIDEIGRAYGVHRATAARWLERARSAIRGGLRAGLGRRQVELTDSEFASVARGLASELELRLSGSFLGAPNAPPSLR